MCNDSNRYHISTDFVSNSMKQSNFPTRTVAENKLIQSCVQISKIGSMNVTKYLERRVKVLLVRAFWFTATCRVSNFDKKSFLVISKEKKMGNEKKTNSSTTYRGVTIIQKTAKGWKPDSGQNCGECQGSILPLLEWMSR